MAEDFKATSGADIGDLEEEGLDDAPPMIPSQVSQPDGAAALEPTYAEKCIPFPRYLSNSAMEAHVISVRRD